MDIEKIKKIRSLTGCPIWAIVKCLEIARDNQDEAITMLERIYAWYYNLGDHPNQYLKRKEEALRRGELI